MSFSAEFQSQVVFSVNVNALLDEGSFDSAVGEINDGILSKKAHTVYNFEVAHHHTYIADSIRVHNTSVLSIVSPDLLRYVDWESTLTNPDNVNSDRGLTYVEIDLPNNEGYTYYKLEEIDGVSTGVMYHVRVREDGVIIQFRQEVGPGGQPIGPLSAPIALTGMSAGEQVGTLITPFLTSAIIGEDASVFEEIAVSTILGTFVENIFEFSGGVLHGLINEDFRLQGHIDEIAGATFDDFGVDIASNVFGAVSSQLTNWIMAEVFGSIGIDGVAGDIANALVQHGVDYLVDLGMRNLINGLLTQGGLLDGLFTTQEITAITSNFTNGGFTIDTVSGLIYRTVFQSLLPEIETIEGMIASGVTGIALGTAFGNLTERLMGLFGGGASGVIVGFDPVSMIISAVVGRLFDALFDDDPRAFTTVVFNEDSGFFELGDTTERDGGNTELSEAMAQTYVDFMNALITQSQSESNNFSELADEIRLVFGHYERHIRNGDGRNYDTLDEALQERILETISELEIVDGDLNVRDTILETGTGYGVHRYFNNLVLYAVSGQSAASDPIDIVAYLNEDIDVSLGDVLSAWGWDDSTPLLEQVVSIINSQGGALGFWQRDFSVEDLRDPNLFEADPFWQDALYSETSLLEELRVRMDRWNREIYLDGSVPSGIIFHGDVETVSLLRSISSIAIAVLTASLVLDLEREGYSITTFQDLSDALIDAGTEHLSLSDLYEQFTYEMQIAQEFREYLQNQSTYDALIAAAGPDSAYAQGWALTLMEAQRLGFTDDYFAVGDGIDNRFLASAGNDTINGLSGADTIYGYAGNDELHGEGGADQLGGGLGDDTIFGGGGADTIYGGSGADSINGGDQSDVIDAGAGDDTVTGGNGLDYVELGEGHDLFLDTDQTGIYSHDTVNGGAGNDTILGLGGDDSFSGGDGDDSVSGGDGDDTIWGGLGADILHGDAGDDEIGGGEGADTIEAGDGNDLVRGGAQGDHIVAGLGNDTVYGDGGNDIMYGEAGDDELWGGDGNDTLIGGAGSDVLGGGAGDDTIYVGAMSSNPLGNDTAYGGDGNDSIVGSNGANLLYGDAGNDTLNGGDDYATSDRDTLYGGDGNDLLISGLTTAPQAGWEVYGDYLYGGTGNDTLIGGLANDVLQGGAGSDVFVFSSGGGADTISDFANDVDTLNLENFGYLSTVTDALSYATQVGSDVLFDFGADGSILLIGVTIAQLENDIAIV